MSQTADGTSAAKAPPSYEAGWRELNRQIIQGGSFSGAERDCLFLNTGGPRFANVSGASGIDFADDGRAVAAVDWDQDGALDYVEVNRTGPQVRLLHNEATGHHFVALRLEGRASGAHPVNRDAIGARVEVSAGGKKLARSLRAGEGYLSQGSKWIHVGLGMATAIDRVAVRWPAGPTEEFSGVTSDGRFELVQGSGRARSIRKRAHAPRFAATPPGEAKARSPSRVPLAASLPMPRLGYTDAGGKAARLDYDPGRFTLVNLWASYCTPCLGELRDLGAQAERIRAAGVRMVALSVETLDPESAEEGARAAKAAVARLGIPFETGFASAAVIDALHLVHGVLFRLDRPLPIPTSFLVDEEGHIAVIYRTAVEVEGVLSDVAAARRRRADSRASAQPFPGRWVTPPRTTDLRRQLAQKYVARGWLEEAARVLRDIVRSHPADEADVHENLAAVLTRLGDSDGAARERESGNAARAGGEDSPGPPGPFATPANDLEERRQRARALSAAGSSAEAIREYRALLALAPDDARSEHRLAFLLATDSNPGLRDGKEAVRRAEHVAEETARNIPEVLDTLAAAYAEAGRFKDAEAAAGQAIRLAEAAGKPELAATFRKRQETYRGGRPLRLSGAAAPGP